MILNTTWSNILTPQIQEPYFIKLQEFVDAEYDSKIIFPVYENIFRAFNLISPKEVKDLQMAGV